MLHSSEIIKQLETQNPNMSDIEMLLLGKTKIRDKERQVLDDVITRAKLLEETLLELFDYLEDSDLEIDKKWLAIARVEIESGIMKFIRAARRK